jgi:hypothetical protein
MKTNKEYSKLEADLWRTLCERDAAVKALSLARESIAQMIDYGKASAESEREACAKVCEAGVNSDKYPLLTDCAAAIRARGNT